MILTHSPYRFGGRLSRTGLLLVLQHRQLQFEKLSIVLCLSPSQLKTRNYFQRLFVENNISAMNNFLTITIIQSIGFNISAISQKIHFLVLISNFFLSSLGI